MKFLKDTFKKHEQHFVKGGKLEKFYPVFEATESFLFTTKSVTQSGVHVRDPLDSKRMMSMVIVALLPCILFGAYNVGLQQAIATKAATNNVFELFSAGMIQILPMIVVSYAVGGTWEMIFSVIRKHEINEGFLVTGILFPLTLPADIPLWQVAMGVSFGVVIGKEIFGGTGMNVLNPALTARAFLYFSYPVQISGDQVWVAVDGYSCATPLSQAAAGITNHAAVNTVGDSLAPLSDMFLGMIPGSVGETSVVACLIGALILIISGVGSWRVMVSVVVGAIAMSLGLNAMASESLPPILTLSPWQHLCMGGLMFGAVFMATDPVSASRTNTGKWIYGFMIGAITILVRGWNPAYPEGTMLAILFMNIFAPLIDYFVVRGNIKRRLSRGTA